MSVPNHAVDQIAFTHRAEVLRRHPREMIGRGSATGLEVVEERVRIGLYPFWASWIFGRRLHTITHLRPIASASVIAGAKGA